MASDSRVIVAVDPGYGTGAYVLAEVVEDEAGQLAPRVRAWGCWRERELKVGFETVWPHGDWWPAIEAVSDGATVVVEGIRVYSKATAAGALSAAQAAGAAIQMLWVEPREVLRPTWAQWTAATVRGRATNKQIRALAPVSLIEEVEHETKNAEVRQAVYDAWGMVLWAVKGGTSG